MKKLFIGSLLALNFLVAYELDFNKEFGQKVQSDLLTTQLTINVSSKDESFIKSIIEDYEYLIKHDELVEKKNGNFSITPKYSYKNGKSVFEEYTGILSYKIETNNSQKLNEFIGELYSLKDKQRIDNTKLSVSNIHWEVSKERYDNAMNNLRADAIKWIEYYSKALRRNCTIKNISLDKVDGVTPPYTRMVAMKSTKEFNLTPSSNEKNIKLYASYKLECK